MKLFIPDSCDRCKPDFKESSAWMLECRQRYLNMIAKERLQAEKALFEKSGSRY